MSTSGLPVLYSFWRSSCSWRVRIGNEPRTNYLSVNLANLRYISFYSKFHVLALTLKNIPHEIKTVDILADKQTKEEGDRHRKEFGEMNPMRFVPVLQIDGATLIESLSILQYLEETRPQPPLLPDDALKRARVREICLIISAGIQPLQNLGVLRYVEKDQELFARWGKHWINHGFTALEKLLTKTAGIYCVGDAITLADCCLVPQVYNARRFKVDLDPYPTIVRTDKELKNHKAFVDTCPSRQSDCPPRARE